MAPRAVSRLSRSSAAHDLRWVLAEPGFRRLFATRLISQAGDGIYTAGFGAYVFFSATTYPNPAAAASAFAVLYLPYSLIGPFAGVFIDRWSRRQILLVSALVRAGLVAVTALLVVSGRLGVPLYVSALAALGVNRFFLASLVCGPAARRPRGQARDGELPGPDGGRDRDIGGGHRRGRRPPAARRGPRRRGGDRARSRGLLPAGRTDGGDHAARLAGAGPGGGPRAGTPVTGPAGGGGKPRRGGGLPHPPPGPGGGHRGDRRVSPAVRDRFPYVDPAVPQLLLPGRQRERGPGPLHPRDHRVRGGLRARGRHLPAGHQTARQGALDRPAARLLRRGGGAGRNVQPDPVPRHGLRSRPDRSGDRDLGHDDHPGADRRRLPGPGVRPVRHDVQRGFRGRGHRRGGRHPGRRQVLSADRGAGRRLSARRGDLRAAEPGPCA